MEGSSCFKPCSVSANTSADEKKDAPEASDDHCRVWQTPDMKDVKLIEDELFDFDVPEEYLNISFNADQEASLNSTDECGGTCRSSSPATLGDHHTHILTGHLSLADIHNHHHHHLLLPQQEEGGARRKVDLITCMPYDSVETESDQLKANGCLMAFTPIAKPTGMQEDQSDKEEEKKSLSPQRPAPTEAQCSLRPSSKRKGEGTRDVRRWPDHTYQYEAEGCTPCKADRSNLVEHSSKLPTPKRQLKKCSTFDKSPVLCSQLKQLREARDGHTLSCGWSASKSKAPPPSLSVVTATLPESGTRLTPKFDLDESCVSSCSSTSSLADPTAEPTMKGKTPANLKPCLVKNLPRASSLACTSGKLHPPVTKHVPGKALAKIAPLKPSFVDTTTEPSSRLASLKPPSVSRSDPKQVTGSGNPDENCQVPRPAKMLPKPTAKQELRSKLTTPSKQSKGIPAPRNQLKVPLSSDNRTAAKSSGTAGSELSSSVADVSFSTTIMCVATPSAKQSTPAKSASRPLPEAADGLELISTPSSIIPTRGSVAEEGTSSSLCLSSIGDHPQSLPVANGDGAREAGQTPGSARNRRSFIPTPGGKAQHCHGDPCSPVTERASVKAVPSKLQQLNPKTKLGLLKPRNGRMFGQQLARQDGPVKAEHVPVSGRELEMDVSCPAQSRVKVVHSPLNKENVPRTPRSQWSPIKRKPMMVDDECIQCTKRTVK